MSLNDKARAALRRELAKAFPERPENDPGHDRLAAALSDTAFVLWGRKDSMGGQWIKISGGTHAECRRSRKSRESEGGWELTIVPVGQHPNALSDTPHTGGDWVACSHKGGQAFRVECKSTGNDCEPIATCSGPDCRANARLIAAAPCMLSALKAAEALIADALDTEYLHDDSHPGARDILAAARAAIARATGGAA